MAGVKITVLKNVIICFIFYSDHLIISLFFKKGKSIFSRDIILEPLASALIWNYLSAPSSVSPSLSLSPFLSFIQQILSFQDVLLLFRVLSDITVNKAICYVGDTL